MKTHVLDKMYTSFVVSFSTISFLSVLYSNLKKTLGKPVRKLKAMKKDFLVTKNNKYTI